MNNDYYFLDGKTNDEISFECAMRIRALREDTNRALYSDWYDLLDKVTEICRSRYKYSKSEIDWAIDTVGATYQTDEQITEMVKIVNRITEVALTDAEYKEHIKDRQRFKPMVLSFGRSAVVQTREGAAE